MTPDDFRHLVERIAPGVQKKLVLDMLQFRVGSRTFATLNWPHRGWAVLKLSAAEQNRVVASSSAFTREPGRARHSGITRLRLEDADPALVAEALANAWREAYPAAGPKAGRRAAAPLARAD